MASKVLQKGHEREVEKSMQKEIEAVTAGTANESER